MQLSSTTKLAASLLIALSLLIGSCSIPPPLVERIKASGELRVVTRNSGTTLPG
ncbi:MAG: hypothetical protein KUF72_17790 [Candidatus Thiodiazotropha sp. (ex Ctena orbiculata)]|nr:hypothetical protein [Candidatus Thiodiazotropha taylori]